jgi:2-phosphosulfolactate phosphatase
LFLISTATNSSWPGVVYSRLVIREGAHYVARWEVEPIDGVVVAVDVLRAFTTAAYAFAAGAVAIWLTSEVEEAIALGKEIPGALVMGEEHGRRPPGFDLSNSPVAVARADVAGRHLVQRTSAGTRGILAATSADHVFAASLVCASATAAAVCRLGDAAPSYLITGRFTDALDAGVDDLLTAKLIERARLGLALEADETAKAIADSAEAARTLALGKGHADPEDIAYATAVDIFGFAMEAERVDGMCRLVRRDQR